MVAKTVLLPVSDVYLIVAYLTRRVATTVDSVRPVRRVFHGTELREPGDVLELGSSIKAKTMARAACQQRPVRLLFSY